MKDSFLGQGIRSTTSPFGTKLNADEESLEGGKQRNNRLSKVQEARELVQGLEQVRRPPDLHGEQQIHMRLEFRDMARQQAKDPLIHVNFNANVIQPSGGDENGLRSTIREPNKLQRPQRESDGPQALLQRDGNNAAIIDKPEDHNTLAAKVRPDEVNEPAKDGWGGLRTKRQTQKEVDKPIKGEAQGDRFTISQMDLIVSLLEVH